MTPSAPLRVAFVVGRFPVVSETFVVDQVAALEDAGVAVEVVAFERGDEALAPRAYAERRMGERTTYLELPRSALARLARAVPAALRLAWAHPRTLLRSLDVVRHGRAAFSLRLLLQAAPLAGRRFDVVHCHFGTVAHDFLPLREVLGDRAPLVTSLYGFDVSEVFRSEPRGYYDAVVRECSAFFVMSHDMRRRVVERGFPAAKVHVLPVGVDVSVYEARPRTLAPDEVLRLLAVGRLVEKKGFDDLLRALAVVRTRSPRPVRCTIVGGGPLDADLRALARSLGVDDLVRFAGPMPLEQVVAELHAAHVLVAPSKTSSTGDME